MSGILAEFVEKITSLSANQTYVIGGQTYSEKHLTRIPPHVDRPEEIGVNSLGSIVKLIRAELKKVTNPVFIRVINPKLVQVFTTYREDFQRDVLYSAKCDVEGIRTGFLDREEFLIMLRTGFIENEDSRYLLELLSRVSEESAVTSMDNGVTQTVEAFKGVALKEKQALKPRVTLRPYRTFLEVEQPESEFLLRLREGGKIGLFEADGGMWKQQAKKNIAKYFQENLRSYIQNNAVIVMM